jgi:hypothetical protein
VRPANAKRGLPIPKQIGSPGFGSPPPPPPPLQGMVRPSQKPRSPGGTGDGTGDGKPRSTGGDSVGSTSVDSSPGGSDHDPPPASDVQGQQGFRRGGKKPKKSKLRVWEILPVGETGPRRDTPSPPFPPEDEPQEHLIK